MAEQDEVIRLDIASDVSEGEMARQKLADVETQVDKLNPAFGRARDAAGRFVAGVGQDAAGARKSFDSMAASAVTATHSIDAGAKQMGSGFSLSTNKLQVFAQGLDDLQYVPEQGLRPILNNLVQIHPVLGIVAIAAQVAYSHFNDLAGLWGAGHTETEADRMEALGKKTEKTADETARLAKHEREREAIKLQETAPTDTESAQTKAVNEAIVNAPVVKVDQAIREMHGPAIRNADPDAQEKSELRQSITELEAQAKRVKATGDQERIDELPTAKLDAQKARLAKLDAALEKRVQDWVREYRGKVATDPGALRAFAADLRRTGKLPDLADKLEEAQLSPEQKKARDDAQDAEIDANLATGTDKHDRRLARNAAAKRKDDANEAVIGSILDPLDAATEWKKQAKAERKKQAKEHDDANEEVISSILDPLDDASERKKQDRAEAERKKAKLEKDKKESVERAEKFTAGTGLDERGELATMRAALASRSQYATIHKVEIGLKQELVRRGMDEKGAGLAAREKATEWFAKVGDDAHARAMSPPEAAAHRGVDRIDAGDFARSVESSGIEAQKKLVTLTEQLKDQTVKLVQNTQNNGRIGP